MRSVILRSIAVIGAGALILAGVLYVASTVDGRSPSVLEVRLTQPAADDDRLALVTTSLEVAFSEPVDTGSAEAAVAITPDTASAASWSGSTMILTPVEPLALETEYVLTIGPGITDLAGNEMGDPPSPFEFATAGSPGLLASTPTDGAVDVSLATPLILTFTALMDTASVEAALRIEPAIDNELRWSGPQLEIVPTAGLAPATEYRIMISPRATDVAGVPLGQAVAVAFRTEPAGLGAGTLVPAPGVDGIATATPIGVVFDVPINPDTVSDDLVTITPDVGGSLGVIRLPDDPESEDGAGSALVFTPTAPLPANTTFTVDVAPGMVGVGGERLGGPLTWSFTTGVPASIVSNQITFLTDRGGVSNVWAMNPDGTGQRQLTSELVPVSDYAIAPDGDTLVVADGWRLVFQRADGSERRVLTDADALEFDPAYSPDGRNVAFARADAVTGAGLGLWEWEVGSGEAEAISLPAEDEEEEEGPSPDPTDPPEVEPALLRAPRYAPDGRAIAFVDAAGDVGILDLSAEELTRVAFVAAAAPAWLPDSSAVMLGGLRSGDASTTVAPPVAPLAPGVADSAFELSRSGASLSPSPFGVGSRVLAVGFDGEIAYADRSGALWITDDATTAAEAPVLDAEPVRAAAFAPGASLLVIEVDIPGSVRLELFDPASGDRTELVDGGLRPRWLP